MTKPIQMKHATPAWRSGLLLFTAAVLYSPLLANAAPAARIALEDPSGTQTSPQTPQNQNQPSDTRPRPPQANQPQPVPSQPVPPQPAQSQTAPAAGPSSPSGTLQPSLDTLDQTINSLKIEKWKGGSVRAEAGSNVGSIQRDLKNNLPQLLADADADPNNIGKLLLVSRNINALYDVLLRVYDASRVAAPGEQISQLEQAMSGVDKARRNLDDSIRDLAILKDKQVTTLQATLKSQPAPVCPAPPPPPPTPAPKKKVVKKKPKPPASTTPPATSTPSTPTKPAGN